MRLRSIVFLLLLFGVGCASRPPFDVWAKDPANARHLARFDAGLRETLSADREDRWTAETCDRVSTHFAAPRGTTYGFGGLYNAGVAQERCGHLHEARAFYRAALAAEPTLDAARKRLVEVEMRLSPEPSERDERRDTWIAHLEFATRGGMLGQARPLLAQLYLERDAAPPAGDSDRSVALKVLARALAEGDDAAYAPRAVLQVVLAGEGEPSRAALDIAFELAEEAVARRPEDPRSHNALGIVRAAARDFSGALAAFAEAQRLDPTWPDAFVNEGRVRLRLRDREGAELAFRIAAVTGDRGEALRTLEEIRSLLKPEA